MAARNYYQAKRQKEISRKTRQDKKQQRKVERAGTDQPIAPDASQPGEQPAVEPTTIVP